MVKHAVVTSGGGTLALDEKELHFLEAIQSVESALGGRLDDIHEAQGETVRLLKELIDGQNEVIRLLGSRSAR